MGSLSALVDNTIESCSTLLVVDYLFHFTELLSPVHAVQSDSIIYYATPIRPTPRGRLLYLDASRVRLSVCHSVSLSLRMVRLTLNKDQNVQIPGRICPLCLALEILLRCCDLSFVRQHVLNCLSCRSAVYCIYTRT